MTERRAGTLLLVIALLAGAILYGPSVGRGLVNYDDAWLIGSNWIVRTPSWSSLSSIWFDLDRDTRAVLGAEYLPIRDLSIMLDIAVWVGRTEGLHVTNVILYLAAIALWFTALCELGIERTVAGTAVLVWALHPAHAESVAWLSERKGLLSVAWAGGAAAAYARYRAGRAASWLLVATLAAIAAVWSKATGAFTIATLAAFELCLPARRQSWRRSLVGLGVLAIATGLAFVPVLVVAARMNVVSAEMSPTSHGWLAMVLGVHGVDVRLALMTMPNAVSYPISSLGPSGVDIAVGAGSLVVVIALAAAPRIAGRAVSPVLRAGALVWLIAWFPTSRIVLPVRQVIVADRYLLVPTLGLALLVAVGLHAIRTRVLALALGGVIVLAAAARTLDAQGSWRDNIALWSRASESNPHDADAWSSYAEALAARGQLDLAEQVTDEGWERTHAPRLILRRALLASARGDRAAAHLWMERAAQAGQPIAMTNLALFLFEARQPVPALVWARKAVAMMPLYVHGYRILGKVALASGGVAEARTAFERAYALEPTNLDNRFNLALALRASGEPAAARDHFEACLADPRLAALARAELARTRR